MNQAEIEIRAFQLRTELFNLITKCQDLHQAAIAGGADFNTYTEINSVACELAEVHDSLPHTFIAAASI